MTSAPQPAGPPSGDAVRVLYIGGWGRSGSTLLDRMLGQVDGLFSIGELREIWERGVLQNRPCGCDVAFRDCPFWSEVGKAAYGGWDALDLDEVLRLRFSLDRVWSVPVLAPAFVPGVSAPVRRYVELLERLYRAISEVSQAKVIVDSSKLPSHAFLLRKTPAIDLRLVHLVRDSRGVAFSWQKEVLKKVTEGEPGRLPKYNAASASGRWLLYNALTANFARLGVPYLRVRYEDILADPRAMLEKILDHVDLVSPEDRLPFLTDHEVVLAPNHTVDGNPMRFAEGPVPLRTDQAWKTRLPRRDRLTVSALTAPMLSKYKYLVRS